MSLRPTTIPSLARARFDTQAARESVDRMRNAGDPRQAIREDLLRGIMKCRISAVSPEVALFLDVLEEHLRSGAL